jgi:phospholipid/cholesterol/gamma-HCH transport system substrate-binding protein
MMSSRAVGAGLFVIVGSLLFAIALFTIGERRMLFKQRFPVYTEFAQLGQLEAGSIVRVAGMNAGAITDIHIPSSPKGRFRVRMEIREDVHGLVRTDSVAIVQTDGLVGAIVLNILSGTEAAAAVASDGTIPSREPFSMTDLLDQASATVRLVGDSAQAMRGDVESTVQQLALTAADAHGLLADIRPDLTAMAHSGNLAGVDARKLLADIQTGKGSLGLLIENPELYNRLNATAGEAQIVMANLSQMSTEARSAIADLRSSGGPTQGLVAEMRVTVDQARGAVADLSDNMEALKHNFLLKGFFNKRGYFSLGDMTPADYRKGLLETGKRKAVRVWLRSSTLFEANVGGAEVLSAAGKGQLDSAVVAYLDYLPANPLIIEGYATDGAASEQFQRARHRAKIVREYLMTAFGLVPQATGEIGLGKDASGSPEDGHTWDGVALALFADPIALRPGAVEASRAKRAPKKPDVDKSSSKPIAAVAP